MAQRPIFIPLKSAPWVVAILVEFPWFPGLSVTQAQRSIRALHEVGANSGYFPLLEVSSKSENPLGISLSAFNLRVKFNGRHDGNVECFYQGSKVFEGGGPFVDLYESTSLAAKKDARIRTSGKLIGFELFGEQYPAQPSNAFYDWLYINALAQRLLEDSLLDRFAGFTDIAFNPAKSWNCQARAVAMFCSMRQAGVLHQAVSEFSFFCELLSTENKPMVVDTGGQGLLNL